jgi:hypothetical protein
VSDDFDAPPLLLTLFHRAMRIKPMVGEMMRTGGVGVLSKYKFMQVAKPLFVRFDKLATMLTSLANLNRTVHLPTYNKLIGEETLQMQAAMCVE